MSAATYPPRLEAAFLAMSGRACRVSCSPVVVTFPQESLAPGYGKRSATRRTSFSYQHSRVVCPSEVVESAVLAELLVTVSSSTKSVEAMLSP